MSLGASEALLAQFEEHLVLTQLSPLTVVNYLADLRALVQWGIDGVGSDFSLARLTPELVRAYRSYLLDEKNCAASTVNRRLHALRKFFAFTVQAGITVSNPADGVQLIQDAGTIPAMPLTGRQIEILLQATEGVQPSLARRDTAILMLFLHAGLRVNELVGLCLDDVQFDHPGIHLRIRDGRNGQARKIPLEGEVKHALHEYLSVRPKVEGESHLFLTREGRPLSPRSVQRIVSARARAAGLEGVSAQALRRTFACRLLANTGDLSLVSQWLGHQNVTTTIRYIDGSIESETGRPAD